MLRIDYHTDMRIWLSLEDYYNAGLTSERTKEIIESITDPTQCGIYSSKYKLHCESSYLEGSWIVTSGAVNKYDVEEIVSNIKCLLDIELSLLKISNVNSDTSK